MAQSTELLLLLIAIVGTVRSFIIFCLDYINGELFWSLYLLVHLLPFSMVTGVSLQKSNPIHTPLRKIKCIPIAFRINSKPTYVWPLATSLLPHPIPTFPESSHMQLCELHTLS